MNMNPDYYATLAQKKYKNGFQGIDYCDTDAVTTRYHVLVATGHKDDKDTGGNALREEWAKQRLQVELDPLPDFLQPPSVNLALLPFGSFSIRFEFKLLKPYISRDENAFYIVDNPIVRDKVFRLPMVRPTAWKGALRHAFWQLGYQEDDQQIQRLFGAANDDQPKEGNAGRLYFYPTFFTETGLEIINPHDRKRRVGKNPILFESVPPGAKGCFTLLYVPFDRVGKDEAETRREIFDDLQRVAEGLQALFTVYGFGAKTGSGFGVAEDGVENSRLALNIPDVVFPQDGAPQAQKPDDEFQKYLDETGQVKAVFKGSGEGGLLSNNEYKQTGAQHGGGSLSEFKQFRNWYGQFGEQWQAGLPHSATPTDYSETTFESLSQLVELCQPGDAANGGVA